MDVSSFMSLKNKTYYQILLLISMLNLLFMHYFFYFSDYLEWTWLYSVAISLCGIVFDVFVILILSLIIVGRRLRPALFITEIITMLWSFVNVMYGRFFFQYLSLSAIGEAQELGDSLVVNSVMSAFHLYDLYYIVSLLCFVVVYRMTKPIILHWNTSLRLISVPVISILLTFLFFSVYHFLHPKYRNNWELYVGGIQELSYYPFGGGTPNLVHFQNGCVRVLSYEVFDLFSVNELTPEQISEIENFYLDKSHRTTSHQRNPKIRNVILIILESFLSEPIDLKVDDKEITPFLNSLKRDSDVYYNGGMISDIGCGESGDGQFIYMTGILPLHHKITVGQVKDNKLPALPIILRNELDIENSELISPTNPNLWQQNDMNKAYGIKKGYWRDDITEGGQKSLDDKSIFDFAANQLNTANEPFFSVILSLSTHSPYNKFAGTDYLKGNKTLKEEYKNYLNSCHFLDEQLQSYFVALKDKGLYENSLIIIASDHYAHLDMLGMRGKITSHIPLFIINGGFDINNAWHGEFHQVDTYTTLLDLLGIDQSWLGVGTTILSPNYTTSVNDLARNISRMIIEGDYFSKSNL